MGLLQLAVAGAAGYGLYRYAKRARLPQRAAYASGEASGGVIDIRNAGADATRSASPLWDKIDETIDESFPASDPPAIPRAR